MAGVIRMSCEDCKCAIDLLGEHEAGKRVCKGELAERQQQPSAFSRTFGPSIGRSDRKYDQLRTLIALVAQPLCKCFRGHLTATTVEEHYNHGRAALLAFRPLEKGFFRAERLGSAFAKF